MVVHQPGVLPLLLFISFVSPVFLSSCPDGQLDLALGDSDYKKCAFISSEKATWQEAIHRCVRMNGLLFTSDDREDVNALQRELWRREAQGEYWIGAFYNWKQGSWVWGTNGHRVRDSEMVLQNMIDTRSSNAKSLEWHCAALGSSESYTANAVPCYEEWNYICLLNGGKSVGANPSQKEDMRDNRRDGRFTRTAEPSRSPMTSATWGYGESREETSDQETRRREQEEIRRRYEEQRQRMLQEQADRARQEFNERARIAREQEEQQRLKEEREAEELQRMERERAERAKLAMTETEREEQEREEEKRRAEAEAMDATYQRAMEEYRRKLAAWKAEVDRRKALRTSAELQQKKQYEIEREHIERDSKEMIASHERDMKRLSAEENDDKGIEVADDEQVDRNAEYELQRKAWMEEEEKRRREHEERVREQEKRIREQEEERLRMIQEQKEREERQRLALASNEVNPTLVYPDGMRTEAVVDEEYKRRLEEWERKVAEQRALHEQRLREREEHERQRQKQQETSQEEHRRQMQDRLRLDEGEYQRYPEVIPDPRQATDISKEETISYHLPGTPQYPQHQEPAVTEAYPHQPFEHPRWTTEVPPHVKVSAHADWLNWYKDLDRKVRAVRRRRHHH